MAAFEWQDSYSVGVTALDDQHKVLIDLINSLETIGSDGDDLRRVMDSLDWYVRKHFSLEEQMMRNAGYDDIEAHIEEHRDFEKWLRAAQSHMATGGIDANIVAMTVNDHLKDWLGHHILVVDMDYKGKVRE